VFFEYKGISYPEYLKEGPGSRFITEFAKEFCKGKGINIGYGSDKVFDNCILFDIKDGYDCNSIPYIDDMSLDFVFSSHTLEHMNDWQYSLNDWHKKLKKDGCLFLYLPHYTMEYWKPENNKKHKHILFPEDIKHFLSNTLEMKNVIVTGVDLYWSYCAVGFKI